MSRASRPSRLHNARGRARERARRVPARLARCRRRSARRLPPTSASPRRSSWTTSSGPRCGSSRRRSSCRSPGIRASAPHGFCARRRARSPCSARRPASFRCATRKRSCGSPRAPSGRRRSSTSSCLAPADVDALDGAPGGEGWAYCWAWEDEEAGRVRARSFVTGGGIAEDEATGSAALALCAQLGRPIQIRQGQGSEIFARPLDDGFTEVGGRSVADEVRDYPIVDSR